MNNCDTYFMIMRIFPVLLMAITGCVIRHTQKINQHYSYTHYYYLAACQLLGVVCMLCMLRVSFFFLVSFSSMSTHTYILEDLRGQKITLNQFWEYYWKDLTFFHSRSLGILQNLQKHIIWFSKWTPVSKKYKITLKFDIKKEQKLLLNEAIFYLILTNFILIK